MANRVIRHQDGPSKIADPANFEGLARPGGGGGAGDAPERTVARIYQLSLCAAITAAAARSGRAR